jgi:hypothetical protein
MTGVECRCRWVDVLEDDAALTYARDHLRPRRADHALERR